SNGTRSSFASETRTSFCSRGTNTSNSWALTPIRGNSPSTRFNSFTWPQEVQYKGSIGSPPVITICAPLYQKSDRAGNRDKKLPTAIRRQFANTLLPKGKTLGS